MKLKNGIELTGTTKQTLNIVYNSIHDDLWDLMIDVGSWGVRDLMIYGYFPWDYGKELKICMELQE